MAKSVVAVLAPMRHELRPLARPLTLRRTEMGADLHAGALGPHEIVATITGIGTRAAARATERVLDAGRVDRVVVVGIAGAIAPSLALGELVVPERVLDLASGRELIPSPLGGATPCGTLATSDELQVEPAAIARLAARGVVAIDMETAAVGAVCERRGVPWSVFRAISDRAGDAAIDGALLGLAGPDGGASFGALARLLLREPRRLRDLVRLGRQLRRATQAAAEAAVRALAGPAGA